MKVQNNVLGENRTIMREMWTRITPNTNLFTQHSGQEERQRPGNLKKVFDKKILTPPTKLSSPKYSRHWLYHKQV